MSEVVVDDRTTVELVASGRVVVVLLLVVRAVVEVLEGLSVDVVVARVVAVVVAAVTTTTPVIPWDWGLLQWYGYVPGAVKVRDTFSEAFRWQSSRTRAGQAGVRSSSWNVTEWPEPGGLLT